MACNGPNSKITSGINSSISVSIQTTTRGHPSSWSGTVTPHCVLKHCKLSCPRHDDAGPRLRTVIFGNFLHVDESPPTAQRPASLCSTAIGRRQKGSDCATLGCRQAQQSRGRTFVRAWGSLRLRLTPWVGPTTALPPSSDDPMTGCLRVAGRARPGSSWPSKEADYSRRSSQRNGSSCES